MKLIVMRHAKSDWSTSAGSDHARPLNPRGQDSARKLGEWLRAQGHQPDLALVSTATRTRQTFDLLHLPDLRTQYVDVMYHAPAEVLFDTLMSATGETVLMVGHNPGMAEFAARIVAAAPQHDRFRDYPTGATLVVEFPAHKSGWAGLEWHNGNARDFVIPRELPVGAAG